jgi:hypothetical protein
MTMRPFSIFIFTAGLAIAKDSGGVRVWGNFQNDLIALQTFGREFKNQFDFTGDGILTLNARNKDNTSLKVEGSADIVLLYGAAAGLIPRERQILLLTSTEGDMLLDLRKLYAVFFLPFGDFFVGRQIINFGQGLVFSPIDVFSSINVFELNFKRSGSDVARLRIPFGSTAGAEATGGLVGGGKALAALKLYGNCHGVDLAAIGIYRGARDDAIGGITFKGDLIAGIYGELAGHVNTENHRRYADAMFGADYSIRNTWFFNAEYLCSGGSDSGEAPPFAQLGLGGGSLSGRHNGYASVRYLFNEITSLTVATVFDPEKRLGFLTGQVSRDILQNATMSIYARCFFNGESSAAAIIPDVLYGVRLNAAF